MVLRLERELLRLPDLAHAAAAEAPHQPVVAQHAAFGDVPGTGLDRSLLAAAAEQRDGARFFGSVQGVGHEVRSVRLRCPPASAACAKASSYRR